MDIDYFLLLKSFILPNSERIFFGKVHKTHFKICEFIFKLLVKLLLNISSLNIVFQIKSFKESHASNFTLKTGLIKMLIFKN